jgi:hypothetical protein
MFPVYRKYAHNKTFYKVISKLEMIEIKTLGNTYFVNTINAKILPDRNLIMDVIENANSFLLDIDEQDYNSFFEHCEITMKKSSF